MKKGRFSEDQIIGILKEQQAGLPVTEICQRHGLSDATFSTWRSRYGGWRVSDARRLKTLDEENRRLKTHQARSRNRRRTTPWRAGMGPSSTIRAKVRRWSSFTFEGLARRLTVHQPTRTLMVKGDDPVPDRLQPSGCPRRRSRPVQAGDVPARHPR